MKLISEFQDERIRKVADKQEVAALEFDISLEAGESGSIDLPTSTAQRTLFVESQLTLPTGVYTTTALVLTSSVQRHTLTLTPFEAQVIPLEADVDEFQVTSNASSLGVVRIVVLWPKPQ